MNPVLGIDFHEEMHVIRHDLQFEKLCTRCCTDIAYNRLETDINPVDQYGTAILWTPDNVVLTRVDDVIV